MTTSSEVPVFGGSNRSFSTDAFTLWVLHSLAGILVGIAAILLTWLATREAESAVFNDPRAGSLMLKDDGGGSSDATRLGIDVNLTVSGPTIRARVTQVFRNPTQNWVEAVYVYPLPAGGAVDTLKMVVGDRIILGDIKERGQARVIYEQARQSGQRAALTEQERPNIFTNSVANIGPGETVLVQIEYQQPVRQSGEEFSLRVPLVVGPRYNPLPVVQTVDLRPDGGGWGATVNDPVPDRDRISPPVLDPTQNVPVNPTSITIRLQAGFPLGEVKSHHHAVKVESPDVSTRLITLGEGSVPADRDFELTWKAAAEKTPSVGLFREHVGNADYLLAFVTPPATEQTEQPSVSREVIFVIDNSGSMGGTSIVQAKASLIYALGRLRPSDSFNVIRFDNTMDMLFGGAVQANDANVRRAISFVGALQASGGTEMVPAMRAALFDRGQYDSNHVRQVIFLTDGAIGNEQQLFETITRMRGRSRIFMIGIGSAPNNFLMTRAAEIGRGTFTHIGSAQQVEERMRELFAKLENPVVTGITARFSDGTPDMTPATIPDLYRGEPLVLAARLDQLAGNVEIKGLIGERPWAVTLPLANAAEGKGLSKIWARRKITDAETARTMRRTAPEEADKIILALALEHQLVTRLTSLVAVEDAVTRPKDETLVLSELPINLPAGWDYAKVFGDGARPTLPAPTRERRADAAAGEPKAELSTKQAASPATPAAAGAANVARLAMQSQTASSVVLPQTATDTEFRMMVGALLVTIGLSLFVLFRLRLARGERKRQ